jgi:signal transduction histidine kinase
LIAQLAKLNLSLLTILKLLPIAFILGIILTKLFALTEKFFSSKLVYTNYHPVKDLQAYNKSISQLLKLEELTDQLSLTIKTLFHTNQTSILVLDKKGNLISKSSTKDSPVETDEIYSILKIWENLNSNRMIIYSEFKNSKRAGKRMIDNNRNRIIDFLEKNSLEIMYPLDESKTYTGVIVIGRKEDKSSYTITDIEFLESLVQSTQIALARAFLYFEVENFNKSLQEKVNEQTKELQTKVEQLQEARRKERDMIDIMGHELRTPATIVKLNSAFLTKFIDEIHSDPQGYKKYVERIQDAIENEITLINTLLNSAKLEGNQIELSPEKTDLTKEIEMAIHGNENEAKKKNLVIIDKTDKNTPYAYADKARLNEILNNLISNAIKYTDKGGILVHTSYNDKRIKISIADSGKGIPKEDIPRLGQKFYRVSTYIESSQQKNNSIVRPGGTGLGLFVTFNLVKMMGGEIWVQSELNKGSVFSFTIPRYTNQVENNSKDSSNMFERLGLKK